MNTEKLPHRLLEIQEREHVKGNSTGVEPEAMSCGFEGAFLHCLLLLAPTGTKDKNGFEENGLALSPPDSLRGVGLQGQATHYKQAIMKRGNILSHQC